ncbi:hypothetical protein [Streptomyces sp. WM6378]|uniref:hypothetical protein n=1 Tax=Streptomyces sp. WM6378 TaxID=1415557 RepID=UPI0006AED07D|nr:hypothetical protein [Streptomyces sp. WM6378]KOU39312.1 hypothetical protein ADK54_26210 [Streptomyces sp. WM6378]
MAIELAVALGALAARAVVAQLIQGRPMDNADWAGVATQVVDVLVTTSTRQESDVHQLGQKFTELGRKVDLVGEEVRKIPGREFEEYMAAGRRYVRDLPDAWRSRKDRRELIRDARREFVHAYGIAEHMKSPQRQAVADVAIAGCWLWVPSLPDVRKTIGAARGILEKEMLYGTSLPTKSYADVLYLCKRYGEQPANAGKPILPATPGRPPTGGARLAVRVKYGDPAVCAGVEMRVEELPPEADDPPRAARPGTRNPDPLPLGRFPRNPQPPTLFPRNPQPPGRFQRTPQRITHFPLNPQPSVRDLGFPQAPVPPPPRKRVRVHVRNHRAECIAVSVTADAVIARLPGAGNTLPTENRVRPGAAATFELTRPRAALNTSILAASGIPAVPGLPNIGFVLP